MVVIVLVEVWMKMMDDRIVVIIPACIVHRQRSQGEDDVRRNFDKEDWSSVSTTNCTDSETLRTSQFVLDYLTFIF